MPRPRPRVALCRKLARAQRAAALSDDEFSEDSLDSETEDEVSDAEGKAKKLNSVSALDLLQQIKLSGKPYHGPGDSERTNHRKRAAEKKLVATATKHASRITNFFTPPATLPDSGTSSEDEDQFAEKPVRWKPTHRDLDELIDSLTRLGVGDALGRNAAKAKRVEDQRKWSEQDKLRYLVLLRYFQMLRAFGDGETPQVQVSLLIAQAHFAAGPSRAAAIRAWATFFRKNGEIPPFRQGRHQKTSAMIDDEDIRQACVAFLRSQTPEQRCTASFCKWFSEVLNVKLTGVARSKRLAESTARAWFEKLGWVVWDYKKGLYKDGHEEPETVGYRTAFLDNLAVFQRRMETYSGEHMDVNEPPQLVDGERRVVMVVQDECVFHANEGKKRVLVEKGHTPLRPKDKGRGIMLSGFLCPCHGRLRLNVEQLAAHPVVAAKLEAGDLFPPGEAFMSINIGKNADGYWTNADLVAQLKDRVIPIFNVLHPGCEALFMFDNSQNHHAMESDALVAERLNLGDGGKNTPTLRQGWYLDAEGNRITHVLQHPPQGTTPPLPKGVKCILEERGLWPASGLKLPVARLVLASQPDFKEQKEWLAEIVLAAEHSIMYFPKYHCEFNCIENMWGRAKVHTRENCLYTFSALRSSILPALDSVSLETIRRYAQRCDRYMDAYRSKDGGARLTCEQVERAVKKYKSHRKIPCNFLALHP